MATQDEGKLDLSCKAAADLSAAANQYKFVEITGESDGVPEVNVCNAATDVPLGVLQNRPGSGQAAVVRVRGVTKIQADAALATPGTQVGTSADGQADAKVPGTDITEYVRAITLEAVAAAGNLVRCLLVDPHRAS